MSDEFLMKDYLGRRYTLRIWGVNRQKGTKHCMSLIFDGAEIETFHLDDLYNILRFYPLQYFWTKDGWKTLNRQNLIVYSAQLQTEGKGQIKDGTNKLMNMMRRRHG